MAPVIEIFAVDAIVLDRMPARGLYLSDRAALLRGHRVRGNAGIGDSTAAKAVKLAVGFKGCCRQIGIGKIRLIVIDVDICAAGIIWN